MSEAKEHKEDWRKWYLRFCEKAEPDTDSDEVILRHLMALVVIKNSYKELGDDEIVQEVFQHLRVDLGIFHLLESGRIRWSRNENGEIVYKRVVEDD